MSLSFALSIPKIPFSMDCGSLINLMLNLEIFLKDIPESADKVALLIPVYHVLFISLKNVSMSGIRRALWPHRCSRNFFCPPIKCHPLYSGPRRPYLNWQHFQMTSFTSVGLDFIKLGGCWGSNRKCLLFKFQLQWCCQWAWPFITPLLALTFFFSHCLTTIRHLLTEMMFLPWSAFSCTLQAWLISLLWWDVLATG